MTQTLRIKCQYGFMAIAGAILVASSSVAGDVAVAGSKGGRCPAEVLHVVSAETPFLLVPVDNGEACRYRLEVHDGEKRVRFWNVGWGTGKVDWYAPLDLSEFAGRELSFRIANRPERMARIALAGLRFAAKPELPANVYDEPKRSQLRLSPTLGWNNDPNGLSWRNGEYHVFFQHNPCGRIWQNMTWGHFVSKDLVHWRDVGDVIHPDALGPMYSGSAVTDKGNTAGFGENAHVLAYTAAGNPAVQCLAYSTDGRRYVKYGGNPVIGKIKSACRDPKVFWHEPTRQWVQLLYVGAVEKDGDRWHTFHIFNSPDLKNWTLTDVVYGDKDHKEYPKGTQNGRYLYECPDLVELKVEGTGEKLWVIWGASGEYGIGTFDGRKFKAGESRIKTTFNHRRSGSNRGYYAAQSFADDPKGRTVWMPWMKLETKDANFNQGFGIPMSLSLKRTEEGLRLAFDPVEEYKTLRDGTPMSFEEFDGELAEAFFTADVSEDASIVFDLRGEKLVFDAAHSCMTLPSKDGKRPTTFTWKAKDGRLSVRFFIDRLGLEVLSGDGLQLAPFATFCPDPRNRSLSCAVRKGRVENVKTRVYRLRSIWK